MPENATKMLRWCYSDGEPQHNQPVSSHGPGNIEVLGSIRYFRPVLSDFQGIAILAADHEWSKGDEVRPGAPVVARH